MSRVLYDDILRAAFAHIGMTEPFSCAYCEERGNLVSGPHSHVCAKCGGKAIYGWYTKPRCEGCKS